MSVTNVTSNSFTTTTADKTTSIADNYSKYSDYFESSSGTGYDLSVETFFQLLMAEMSNQDPLEPTSNSEFVSQLASFSALQNSNDTLYYNTMNYASSLTGKYVTVYDGSSGFITGQVEAVNVSDSDDVTVVVNGSEYTIDSVQVLSSANTTSDYSSVSSDGTFAVSLIGKNVILKIEGDDGETILDSGTVDSVEVSDGEFRITVGDYSYPLSAVVRVANAIETETETVTETASGVTETSLVEETDAAEETAAGSSAGSSDEDEDEDEETTTETSVITQTNGNIQTTTVVTVTSYEDGSTETSTTTHTSLLPDDEESETLPV